MSELIRRKDAVNVLCEGCNKVACCGSPEIVSMWCSDKRTLAVMMSKNSIPAVDAVEVVRCRDCKHAFGKNKFDNWVCDHQDHDDDPMHPADWFCADGEKDGAE